MEFEWDPKKAVGNLGKHGVSFQEAATVFADEFGTTVPDPDHSIDEHRYITIGWSSQRRLLMVAHADYRDRIRIVSARKLIRTERKIYEEESQE